MKRLWKAAFTGLAATAVVALSAAAASAACADLNNDGNVNAADLAILTTCGAGTCPTVSPGPLCGSGTLADCGDVFGDGDVSVSGLTADIDALNAFLTGRDPLYDVCEGPGPEIACPGGTVSIGSPPLSITSSQTWPADCTVVLAGTVTVTTPMAGPTTVLRIEPGSIVKGQTGTTTANPSALIFQPGSRIEARGTQTNPIIFTSTAAAGTRSKGDWGGVVINGRGTVNGPGCMFQSEGLPFSFGGCEADYHAGVAKFVRVEFAGLDFSANNELNLWTMNGLGTQTDFDFIEAIAGDDDCLEWFGGTSNHDHMIAAACGDDGFDFQLGWTGSVQYGLMIQEGTLTDPNPPAQDSRGIEGDNSEFDPNAIPRSDPDFCNMTFVGAKNQAGENGGSDAGILLRRGARAQIANTIVTSFTDNCVELRDTATTQQACVDANADGTPESLTGNVVIRNSILANCGSGVNNTEVAKNGDALDADDATQAETGPCDLATAPGCACDSESWYALLVAGFNVPNANGAAAAVLPNLAGGDLFPALNNGACTGAGLPYECCTGAGTGSCRAVYDGRPSPSGPAPAPFACANINPLFNNAGYLGAINPAASCSATGCDWIQKPWAEFNVN